MPETRTRPDFEYEGTRDHRVKLIIQDGYLAAKLVCPEQGCAPAHRCGHCGHVYGDDETEPCYDCKDHKPTGECWLKGWFDNCTADELLHGKVEFEVPIAVGWDMDHPVVTLVDPEPVAALSPGDQDA